MFSDISFSVFYLVYAYPPASEIDGVSRRAIAPGHALSQVSQQGAEALRTYTPRSQSTQIAASDRGAPFSIIHPVWPEICTIDGAHSNPSSVPNMLEI